MGKKRSLHGLVKRASAILTCNIYKIEELFIFEEFSELVYPQKLFKVAL